MKLEEQLRNDAQSLREVGWFNRAEMLTAAADEIHRLEKRTKRLEEAGDRMRFLCADGADCDAWDKAKEENP